MISMLCIWANDKRREEDKSEKYSMYVYIRCDIFGTVYDSEDRWACATCANDEAFELVKTTGRKCSKTLLDVLRKWLLLHVDVCVVKRFRTKNASVKKCMSYTEFTENSTNFRIVTDRTVDFGLQRFDNEFVLAISDVNKFKLYAIFEEIAMTIRSHTGMRCQTYFRAGNYPGDIRCDTHCGNLSDKHELYDEFTTIYGYISDPSLQEKNYESQIRSKVTICHKLEMLDEVDILKYGEVAKEYWKGLIK